MHIVHADFLTSATNASQWPSGDLPEVALCGRSNVGKSTLLNALLQRNALARVSRTPGRTRLLNFFSVTAAPPKKPGAATGGGREQLLLADLPGFGYAQISRSEHGKWRPMMEQYLTEREPLRAVVLLCDGRRAADPDAAEQLFDEMEIARFLHDYNRIVIPVLTKADKLSKHERKPTALGLQRLFGQKVTVVSGQTGEGMDELWLRIVRALAAAPARPAQDDPGVGDPDAELHRSGAADQGVMR
jgi:GTP-binding protein